jgi:WW domain-binding protein 4
MPFVPQSRTHHDTGMRHKGNLERYIRGIYKKGHLQEREKANEARDIAAIDAAAAAAMGISAEQASTSAGGPSAPQRRRPAPASKGGLSNYSSAASLGFQDVEAERLQRERETREKEGFAGEWTFVAPEPGPSRPYRSTSHEESENQEEDDPDKPSSPSNEATDTKQLEEPDNRKISHSFFKEKALPVLDDDGYDSIKIKVRRPRGPEPAIVDPLAKARQQARTQAAASGIPALPSADAKSRFKSIEMREYEETPEELEERNKAAWALIQPKGEGEDTSLSPAPERDAPLFKKRKIKPAEGSSTVAKKRG